MTASVRAPIPAALIPGDGIGPEIVAATERVLEALSRLFEWQRCSAGMAAVEAGEQPLPQATLESIRRTRLALKGPLTTPVGSGYRSVNVALRNELTLFANVRPARTLVPGGRFEDVDIVLIRENLEGLYVGYEHYIPVGDDPKAVAEAAAFISRHGCRRVAEFAYEYAAKRGRRRITIVHKANILKALTGLFLEVCREVGRAYEGRVETDDRIVDNCAMQLVINPQQFDVILTTNMFGDILSDEIAGLVGGLGLAPGANFGRDAAIFEAIHGSAPDIAGRGVANPVALMLAAAMMLEHVGRDADAARLRRAIGTVLAHPERCTPDLGGRATTEELAEAIIDTLDR